MALDLTAEGLNAERDKAIDHRDSYLGDGYRESIERFVGPGFRRTVSGPTDFNNHAYKLLSVFLPMLASGNPRVRTKTPRQGSAAALAKAAEFAQNRNWQLTNMKRTVEQLATDWFFKWSVALTSPRPVMGLLEREDPPYRPTTKRLSLLDYIWDPVALQPSECRYQAHRIIRDKDSLAREADEFPGRGWNLDAIAQISSTPEREKRGEKLQDNYDRDEVEFWEFWVPEAELEDATTEAGKRFQPTPERGFHGTVYTVSRDLGIFLREPRPYFGHRDGPYTFNGYLYVPDRAVHLSMLTATAAQAEVHNAVWNAAVEAIKRYKKGIAVSSSAAADLAEKIKGFEDMDVFEIEGWAEDIGKAITEIEKGGLTQQHMTMLQVLGLNLEQMSGLSEAAMGQVSGDSTATEASIANMSSSRRMGYAAEKFNAGMLLPIAEKETFFLTMHPKGEIALGPEAEGVFIDPVTGEPIEYPALQGTLKYASLLEDMDIGLEPTAQRYTSEVLEAQIATEMDAWIATFGPMIPQMPWIEWEQHLQRKADQWRDPSFAKVVNVNKARVMGQMMFQMNLQGIPPTSTPQPRLASDIQPAPSLKTSEKVGGFSRNARPGGNAGPQKAQDLKGPRQPGASSATSMNGKA